MVVRVELPAGHRSGLETEGHGLDVPAEVQDLELLAADVEHAVTYSYTKPSGSSIRASITRSTRSERMRRMNSTLPRCGGRAGMRYAGSSRPGRKPRRRLTSSGVAPLSAE